MNLWGALGIASPFGDRQRHAAGRYPIELLRDESGIENTADALVALFKSVCSNARTIDALYTMLREMLGNCYAHSAVTDGVYGVLCAQVWPAGRKAQIALADTGIGIRASLAQNAAGGGPQIAGAKRRRVVFALRGGSVLPYLKLCRNICPQRAVEWYFIGNRMESGRSDGYRCCL
ncbi:hypothetical protein [Janthinobacterium sp. CG_S6]|uniref:hypothetical protein n=1 Tax=Janthinobacterium sp. CG_S6 TaxID=3071707 RepID=UPI002DF8453C|nr:hypothetical protein [Janthinobacterium sp. CG_S6]